MENKQISKKIINAKKIFTMDNNLKLITTEKFGEQYPNKDLNQMIDDYCHNNNLKNCMTMDALAYDKEYRSLFDEMVDAILDEREIL